MDFTHATELGVTRIVPVIAERSVVRPDDLRGRADRWRRIAIEAARQSGRGDAPRIDAPSPLTEALRAIGPSNGACLAPGADRSLGDRLRAFNEFNERQLIGVLDRLSARPEVRQDADAMRELGQFRRDIDFYYRWEAEQTRPPDWPTRARNFAKRVAGAVYHRL